MHLASKVLSQSYVCCAVELVDKNENLFLPLAHAIIRITYLYKEYPLISYLYKAKLWFTGVYLISLFLIQNIDCGYSLEPPRRCGSNVYPRFMF